MNTAFRSNKAVFGRDDALMNFHLQIEDRGLIDLTFGAEGETTYWLDSTSCDT